MIHEGFHGYNDFFLILLLDVALCTICRVFRAERLGSVVASTAELPIVDVLHRDGVRSLLHLEET